MSGPDFSAGTPLYPVPPSVMLPPPPPSERISRSASQSSDSSSRKRKRSAISLGPSTPSATSSAGAFSITTKEKVIALSQGNGCWHCGAPRTEICHVVGRKGIRFSWLQQTGIVPLSRLNDMENAIALCGLCRPEFDDQTNPGFIFMPTDIDYFIRFERRDQRRRKRAQKQTAILLQQSVPGAERYRQHQQAEGLISPSDAGPGGLYHSYILRDYFPKFSGSTPIRSGLSPFQQQPKHWHRLPTAALRRAFLILGTFPTGVPDDVQRKLLTLQTLYARELSDLEDASGTDDSEEDEPADLPDLAASPLSSSSSASGSAGPEEEVAAELPPLPSEGNRRRRMQPVVQQHQLQRLPDPSCPVFLSSASATTLGIAPVKHHAATQYIWGPQSSSVEKMAFLHDVERMTLHKT